MGTRWNSKLGTQNSEPGTWIYWSTKHTKRHERKCVGLFAPKSALGPWTPLGSTAKCGPSGVEVRVAAEVTRLASPLPPLTFTFPVTFTGRSRHFVHLDKRDARSAADSAHQDAIGLGNGDTSVLTRVSSDARSGRAWGAALHKPCAPDRHGLILSHHQPCPSSVR